MNLIEIDTEDRRQVKQPGHRGLGGTALLFSEMHRCVVEEGYLHADLVQIGIDNEMMQRELRDLGIDFYKTHRIYSRSL